MNHPRSIAWGSLALLVALAFATGPAEAQYRYGKSRGYGGGGEDQGFILFFEGSLANPRNTDNVVATLDSGSSVLPIVPKWDDEFAGRAGFGYQWASGSKLWASYWTFNAEQEAAGSGGNFDFAIGPPLSAGTGDAGNAFSVTTEITAETADLTWGQMQELSDKFGMEWSAGLRYARFEETHAGVYRDGTASFDAAKSNEGEMIGVKVGARGVYRVGSFSFTGGLGVSLLDGELQASSGLRPTGGGTPSQAVLEDDGRSGSIRDFDIAAAWHAPGDNVRVSLGWEQSEWQDIASDLVRNFPQTLAPLRDRSSVTFSGLKLGVHFRF